MHNDVVAKLPTRKAARNKAKQLNDETQHDRRADEQLGETI
jgi:hypothetical protein